MVPCFKCCYPKELWDDIISFSLVRNGPVCPMLKDIRRKALKLLSLAFSSHHGCHLDSSSSFHSVRNNPKQKTVFHRSHCILISTLISFPFFLFQPLHLCICLPPYLFTYLLSSVLFPLILFLSSLTYFFSLPSFLSSLSFPSLSVFLLLVSQS